MIFCSVGTQLPFPRLIDYVIQWSSMVDKNNTKIIIQSGSEIQRQYAKNISIVDFISEVEFSKYMSESTFIISHAGMGNIIRAIELNKSIIIVPRLSSLSEHRNNHQVDSARHFSSLNNVFVANDFDSFCLSIIAAYEYDQKTNDKIFHERSRLIDFLNNEIKLL